MSKNKDVRRQSEAPEIERENNAPDSETIATDKAPSPPKKVGRRMYVGPTLINHGIVENTVFMGYELPKNVQALANEHQCVRALIVPVSRLNEVQAALNDPTSIEFKYLLDARKIN